MSLLKDLIDNYYLSRVISRSNEINPTELEKDFLDFSRFNTRKLLRVRSPNMHKVQGEQSNRLQEALKTLNIKVNKLPSVIDISGSFDHEIGQDSFIFLSPKQLEADHYCNTDSYLNPLIENVYSDGASLIRDFCLHEAVIGKVNVRRGILNLNEAHIFPEKFIPGQYTLSIDLDTSKKTIKKFKELGQILEEFQKDPIENLSDPKKVEFLTERGIELRRDLGALSRYEMPEKQTFSVNTDSCVIRNINNTLFYLYLPERKKNILVYFGNPPFSQGNQPHDLTVLSGKEHQNALITLVDLEVFKPGKAVLEQRINGVRSLYDDASRQLGKGISEEHPHSQLLLEKLQAARTYFDTIINPEMLKQYVIKQPPELLEFMVYPGKDDPVLYELLTRLSWNKTLRNYHNTGKFVHQFKEANQDLKGKMLNDISSSVIFTNQQNMDINNWLYTNYKKLCEEQEIKFDVLN